MGGSKKNTCDVDNLDEKNYIHQRFNYNNYPRQLSSFHILKMTHNIIIREWRSIVLKPKKCAH